MGHKWSLNKLSPQRGKRILVTGANSGIGYHTALELARHGATVLLACRSEQRGREAVAQIQAATPGALVELILLDLCSFDSIRGVADALNTEGEPLHVLVNNAGVMAPPQRLETSEGHELQFGVNVLGHFLLTALLEPLLEISGNGRVVTVASIAHKRGRIQFDDLQYERSYDPGRSYAQSKLANLILALEMERRFRRNSSSIVSVACHPGVAGTNLFKTGNYRPVEKAIRIFLTHLINLLLNSSLQGALPNIFAAVEEQAQGGTYYGPQGFREMRGGDVGPALISPSARDSETAERLWQVCEELTGEPFLS